MSEQKRKELEPVVTQRKLRKPLKVSTNEVRFGVSLRRQDGQWITTVRRFVDSSSIKDDETDKTHGMDGLVA